MTFTVCRCEEGRAAAVANDARPAGRRIFPLLKVMVERARSITRWSLQQAQQFLPGVGALESAGVVGGCRRAGA